VGRWIVSNNIVNSLSAIGRMARSYFMWTNKYNESVDLFSFEAAPKNPTHKSIHIHKLAIVACPKNHII
jgi:hypothetical protein